MVYKNPYYKRIKGSFLMIVSCGHCKTDIAKYQKVGKGNLLRMHIDRIIKSSVDLSKEQGALLCPNCGELLGTKMTLKRKNKEVFTMARSAFNTRRVN